MTLASVELKVEQYSMNGNINCVAHLNKASLKIRAWKAKEDLRKQNEGLFARHKAKMEVKDNCKCSNCKKKCHFVSMSQGEVGKPSP